VHVAVFGAKAGWTPAQLHSTVHGGALDDCWGAEDRLVIRLADSLHDTHGIDGPLWAELSACYAADQLVELMMLAGLYHGISYLINGARIQPEAFAPRFPPIE
jgi:hypothetical protein